MQKGISVSCEQDEHYGSRNDRFAGANPGTDIMRPDSVACSSRQVATG